MDEDELAELRDIIETIRVIRDDPETGIGGYADEVWRVLDWLESYAYDLGIA